MSFLKTKQKNETVNPEVISSREQPSIIAKNPPSEAPAEPKVQVVLPLQQEMWALLEMMNAILAELKALNEKMAKAIEEDVEEVPAPRMAD